MTGVPKRCTGIVHHAEFSNQSRPAQSRDRRRYALKRMLFTYSTRQAAQFWLILLNAGAFCLSPFLVIVWHDPDLANSHSFVLVALLVTGTATTHQLFHLLFPTRYQFAITPDSISILRLSDQRVLQHVTRESVQLVHVNRSEFGDRLTFNDGTQWQTLCKHVKFADKQLTELSDYLRTTWPGLIIQSTDIQGRASFTNAGTLVEQSE